LIYYDATQLVHWEGNLTGIPRVMYELAIRFEKFRDVDVVFVSWVKDIQSYVAIDLKKSLGEGINYIDSSDVSGVSVKKPKLSQNLLNNKILRVGSTQLNKVAPSLNSSLKKTIRRKATNDLKKIIPKKGDAIFIPWGEWWDDNFLLMLEKAARDGVRVMPLIHDVGPMVQPQLSAHSSESLSDYCKRIVPISSPTITISELTKKDLTNWLKNNNCKVPQIRVFREGDDFQFAKPIRPHDKAFISSGLKGGDYLLFVSTVELKKNHTLIYYTYKLAKSKGIDLPKILIVGRKGWMTEAFIELITKDPETKDNIILLNNISNEELSWLFDNCLFTVQPSFYEGWGITVAESLSRGAPVIAADSSAMVEIAPKIVRLFSPYSTDQLLSSIIDLLDPKKLETERAKAKQYKPTTWDDSYNQVINYIREFI